MTLWRFADPVDGVFARASRRGTWDGSTRVPPLVIEWEPGSDRVGDFVWPGFDSDLAVTAAVGNALLERFRGFELQPVEMLQEAKRPKRGGQPRVWLPYEGPPLRDLWITCWAHVDLDRSSVAESTVEGEVVYAARGVENWDLEWDQELMEARRVHSPRQLGKGLYVAGLSLQADIFRVVEFPAWMFCTDDVKRFIQERGFTNVGFLEMGDVV